MRIPRNPLGPVTTRIIDLLVRLAPVSFELDGNSAFLASRIDSQQGF
jgi:hypothetical protein